MLHAAEISILCIHSFPVLKQHVLLMRQVGDVYKVCFSPGLHCWFMLLKAFIHRKNATCN